MKKKRKKAAYLILVLLIFLVVAIIGGLAAVLFNMSSSLPSATSAQSPELKTNVVEHIAPVSEIYIEVAAEEIEKPRETRHITGAAVIPQICDGYGSQIKQRDAYKHPVTYRAQIQPNHVQFTLYTDKKLNAKGAE